MKIHHQGRSLTRMGIPTIIPGRIEYIQVIMRGITSIRKSLLTTIYGVRALPNNLNSRARHCESPILFTIAYPSRGIHVTERLYLCGDGIICRSCSMGHSLLLNSRYQRKLERGRCSSETCAQRNSVRGSL